MTSFEGRVKSEMSKNQGFENWDFNFESQKFDSAFDREKIVYLSSESENVLTELEDDKFYIIGGLVDHNSHKGLCHATASDLGVHHARLPIDEFIKLKTRKVLAVNHVYEILAAVSEGKGWQEAFLSIIPERKGVIIKEGDGQAGQQGGEEGGEAGDNGEEDGECGDEGEGGEGGDYGE